MMQTPELSQRDRVLAGGGEMGRLMRSYDWSTTALGPVEEWPQSLRTAASMLLASGYPMLIVWGPEYVQLYNDAYRPVLGAKHPEALGQSTPQCWSEIWESMLSPMFRQVDETGVEISARDLMFPLERHGFVEECYFDFSYSPIRDESYEVGGILVTCSETTGRVLSERRLKALRDLADSGTRATTAEEACRLAAEVLGHNTIDIPFALIYLRDEDAGQASLRGAAGLFDSSASAPLTIHLRAAAENGWPIGQVLLEGEPVLVGDLERRFGAITAGPWPEPTGQALILPISQPGQDLPTGVLVAGISPRLALGADYRSFLELAAGQIATAVSNARAHEEERRRAEALSELDRAKTAFFSNVSHEFRTPLSLLLGPLEDGLADRDAALPQTQRERLEMAHRNGLRLLRLVNTLLDFSRIEAGRVQAVFEPTNLADYTRELASSFRSAIEKAGLRFTVECADLAEPVYLDREMWEKVVLNLLSNAFKFTFEGEIAVDVKERDGQAEVTIRDTGTGIPEAELAHLFERFYRIQGARSRTQEGTGIGLALVQELVRQHGGSIQVDSVVGQGTAFTVRLPFGTAHLPAGRINARRTLESTAVGASPFIEEALRWTDEAGSLAPALLEVAGGPSEAAGGQASTTVRILVADDNADMRAYLTRLLSARYQVHLVGDGEEALRWAQANHPDLILADVMMPGRNGFELLAELRGDPRTHLIPVVLLSARAGEEARVEGLEAGADDYLVKPFSARELLARVSSNLELSQLRRDALRQERAARRQAESQRALLSQLFERAPALMCVLSGPDHVFTLANAKYLDTIGHRSILGKPILEALPEISGQGFIELLDGVYRTGEPVIRNEARVLLARGPRGELEEAFVDFIYTPVRNANGEIEAIFAHGVEVTDHVRDRRSMELLASISRELAGSLDVEDLLDRLARVTVPRFADWCVVEVARQGALGASPAVAHRDPLKVNLARQVQQRWRSEDGGLGGIAQAMRAGERLLLREIPEDLLASGAQSPEDLELLRKLGPWSSALVVPLQARGRTLGAMALISAESERRYGENDLAFAQEAANRAALAVDNVRLYAGEQRARREAERLQALTGHVSRSLAVDEVLYEIAVSAADLLESPVAGVFVLDAGKQFFDLVAGHGLDMSASADFRLPRDRSLAGSVIESGRPSIVPDARLAPVTALPRLVSGEAVGSLIVAPITSSAGSLGVVEVYSSAVGAFEERHADLLSALAATASTALENARRYAAEQRARHEAERLQAITEKLGGSATPDDLLDQVAGTAAELLTSPVAGVFLLDESGEFFRLAAQRGLEFAEDFRLPINHSMAGHVVATGQPLTVSDMRDAPLAARPPGATGDRSGSLVLAPIVSATGPLGVVEVYSPETSAFEPHDAELLAALAGAAAASLEKARLYQQRELDLLRLETIIQQLPIAVIVASAPSGEVTVRNRRAEELFGEGFDVALRRHTGDASRGWRTDGSVYEPESWPLARALAQGEIVSGEHIEIERVDGGRAHVSVNAAPIRDASGRIVAAVAAYDDVSDEEELRRQKDQFLAAAAHDLKTPLTSIRGLAQLLQRQLGRAEPPDVERIGRTLTGIETSTRKMTGLIDELLDISRLGSVGQLSLSRREVDLVELAAAILDEHRSGAPHHTLLLEAEVDQVRGQWDQDRLERVVANLIGNAIKYSPDGGEVRVTIGVIDAGATSEAVLTISDEGIGIPAGDVEHIFERFQRGSNLPAGLSGSGVGLSYVREIVREHGGSISVESRPGSGSRFTIRLPREAS